MKKKAVINLVAGEQQQLVIRKASEMGYAVIAIDRDPQASGFAFADEKICLSAYEPQPIIDRLQSFLNSYEFKGVLTRSSGPAVISAAMIAQAFELPGVKPQVAKTVVYKSDFIGTCHRLSIPAPKHQVVCGDENLNLNEIEFPCIVKPSLGLVGQRAVRVVRSETELRLAFPGALAGAHDRRVVIESFIPGRDVVLMAVVKDAVLEPVVLLDEMNHLTELGEIQRIAFSVPSIYSDTETEKQIHNIGRQIIQRFGIGNSPFLLSCKVRAGKPPVVIELHLDLGADKVLDKLLPASADFDFIRFTISSMTGMDIRTFDPEGAIFKPFSIYYNPFHLELTTNDDAIFYDDSCGIFPGRLPKEARQNY